MSSMKSSRTVKAKMKAIYHERVLWNQKKIVHCFDYYRPKKERQSCNKVFSCVCWLNINDRTEHFRLVHNFFRNDTMLNMWMQFSLHMDIDTFQLRLIIIASPTRYNIIRHTNLWKSTSASWKHTQLISHFKLTLKIILIFLSHQ